MRELVVSRATARFLRQGHPWVRPDRFTRGLDQLETGEAVTLVDEQGNGLASALADPGEAICARVYHKLPGRAFDVELAIDRAWQQRSALHVDPETDCYRIIHGEGDFLPGLRVERYAGVLVVLLRCPAIAVHAEAIGARLAHHAPQARIVIREQFDDLRRREVRSRLWPSGTIDPEETIEGRELGVRLALQPFADLATGIYVDQRETRSWLRQRCQNTRVLNCFAYTGLFSLSLLAAGAAEAHDVDLAAPPLELARQTARRNGLQDRHHAHQAEVRAWLEHDQQTYELIICDPPTAAQGAGGWLARRDYPTILQHLVPRLAPGGLLVAIINTLGKRFDLAAAVTQAFPNTTPLAPPPLGEDLPQLRGFPEGRPFDLVAVRAPG